ncbi:MAG: MotA/TolQ/ExbB proton channel family protein [candidate division KSB1 bacterium]|nr:MotA/TolQ/ExbB proton channel family protein [candidate division KSB1 bacterium]MDZ7368148.1 MotA/TolQ/ExbB proton channel family protein [candidate division KSB1 bacterium]MDZ7405826.1 MotA/TolQ/ExbB proton channel family protein [candidate division KSB1 bacterium]
MDVFIKAFSPNEPGFLYMYVIAFVGAFAIAIAIERAYYIVVRSNINADKFMAEIRKLVKAGEYKKAVALCDSAGSKALPQVVVTGLRVVAESDTTDFRTIQNSVDEGTLEILPKLQARTNFLPLLANVATLLGLMGTIWGLILAFRSVSVPGIDATQKANMLAAGIYTAMNTTLLGLAVAVPTILIYAFIHNKTAKIIDEIDEHTVKLINLLTGNR